MALKTPLQANQLLAGLQKRDPKIHDLFRSIISDLEEAVAQVNTNTDSINKILNPTDPDAALTHGQVMRRIGSY